MTAESIQNMWFIYRVQEPVRPAREDYVPAGLEYTVQVLRSNENTKFTMGEELRKGVIRGKAVTWSEPAKQVGCNGY